MGGGLARVLAIVCSMRRQARCLQRVLRVVMIAHNCARGLFAYCVQLMRVMRGQGALSKPGL